jgi:hypothetical protein
VRLSRSPRISVRIAISSALLVVCGWPALNTF